MRNPHDLIIRPIITEQSMEQTEFRKYSFKVDRKANKTEIKNAIEKIFSVKVEKVNTMNVKGKPKRQGKYEGRRSNWRKAIVTLTEESKTIEFFEGM